MDSKIEFRIAIGKRKLMAEEAEIKKYAEMIQGLTLDYRLGKIELDHYLSTLNLAVERITEIAKKIKCEN
jgi:hypothetical protein